MTAQPKASKAMASVLSAALIGAVVTLAVVCWRPAQPMAQSISETFSTFTSDTSAPIDIESNSLEIHEAKKIAIFEGDVIAIQDGWTLQTDAGGTQITLLKALGTVLISTQDGQSSSSKWAHVDMRKRKITVGGDVVLTQGENILKGDKLVIDLATGRSRLLNPGDGADRPGRVRALFIPGTAGKKAKAGKTPRKKVPAARTDRTGAGGWSTEVR